MTINAEDMYKFRISAKKPDLPVISEQGQRKHIALSKIEELNAAKKLDKEFDYLDIEA